MYFMVFVWGNGKLDPLCVPEEYNHLIPNMQQFLNKNNSNPGRSRILHVDFHLAVKGVPTYTVYNEGASNSDEILALMDFPAEMDTGDAP